MGSTGSTDKIKIMPSILMLRTTTADLHNQIDQLMVQIKQQQEQVNTLIERADMHAAALESFHLQQSALE
jgi:uncharacterized coiled-coil DUF342 family protein